MKDNELTIWDYECNNKRTISEFEKKDCVEYIVSSYKDAKDEALEKSQEADALLDMACDQFQDALNLLQKEDWDGLVELAEEHGIWDPDTDPEHFGIKGE